mmetsp:Transcript_11384/g.35537  ORF Transcript_11384/g.35537 Transcript_11384/m.35537 type:complete len:604 (+) Transcript_11384:45-1856(+)
MLPAWRRGTLHVLTLSAVAGPVIVDSHRDNDQEAGALRPELGVRSRPGGADLQEIGARVLLASPSRAPASHVSSTTGGFPMNTTTVKADLVGDYNVSEIAEGERENQAQEEAERKSGFLVTSMLIGFIVFDMTILYLLNSPDKQMRAYSFKMLSTCIVVFCALSLEQLQEAALEQLSALVHSNHHSALITENVVSFFLFLFWFFGISYVGWYLRHRHEDLHAALGVVLHVAAFTAMEKLGEAQELIGEAWLHDQGFRKVGSYNTGVGLMYLLGPAVTWVLIRLSAIIAMYWRDHWLSVEGPAADTPVATSEVEHSAADMARVVPGSQSASMDSAEMAVTQAAPEHQGSAGHGKAHWKMEVFHAEVDASGIVVGFLMKQCIVYVITAHIAPMDCAPHAIQCKATRVEMEYMILPVLAAYGMVIGLSHLHQNAGGHAHHILELQVHVCMTFSWTVMHLSEWAVTDMVWEYTNGDSPLHAATAKKLATASALSPVLVLVIISIDKLADHNFMNSENAEVTVQCIAFLIGFYWEKVFGSAIYNLTDHMMETDLGKFVPNLTLSACLLCAIIPAWRWYIVPIACLPVPAREAVTGRTSLDEKLLPGDK